jgi:hypothetical protein
MYTVEIWYFVAFSFCVRGFPVDVSARRNVVSVSYGFGGFFVL